jgi:ATP-dependent RNA helicase RhlE
MERSGYNALSGFEHQSLCRLRASLLTGGPYPSRTLFVFPTGADGHSPPLERVARQVDVGFPVRDSMTFAALGLSEPILRAVSELGYATPTPIQAQAIPAVLDGGDLLAGAQTGTGKTAGFVLPILHRLSGTPSMRAAANGRAPIRALVLVPTRELAAQVEESVRDYGKYLRIASMVMFGGVNINPQIRQLEKRVDILVATPGRLLDHAGQRTVDLSQVEILVLDEADRMLDMGFIRDIRKVLALLPRKRQNLLFSATFSDEIKTLADSLLDRPTLIEVARRNATAELVTQRMVLVDRNRKRELLARMITDGGWDQVLVFTRTKHGANRLAEQLGKDGITAMAIHGNKSQGARTRALSEFKDGSLRVLVATDIAARGLDISELPHVVNYELPNVPEDYVHRIGRTGRAGASGEAVSLVCIDEFKFLADIEQLIRRKLVRETMPGFELDPNDRPEPIELGGMRGRMQARRGGQRDDAQGQRSEHSGGGHRTSDGRPAQRSRDAGHAATGRAGAVRSSPSQTPARPPARARGWGRGPGSR